MLAMLRGFAAAFVAAVAAAVISSCGYGVIRILVSTGSLERDVYGAFGFTAMYAAYLSARIVLPAIIVAAVPYVLLSMRLHRNSLRYYVASGALIGLGTVVVMVGWRYLHPMPPFHMDADDYFTVFTGVFAGAVAALTFWKVVRPDRLQNQSPSGR
jgi:hypothetical protein